ncbi:methyltransferase [Limimaricola pyoseonensis]|uniref:Demethylspheroidene O-methyltransferase n=1 Tax=Limimaricola pyoseonensis TaxID=521013 RepID=A0A1G7B1L1_9RHOB|nr:methyltransferase [Limimaricola pyoseonensis]SDE20822.1 demethylspheroidene O-methyltransferase [Limimaricola pyoseonensis]
MAAPDAGLPPRPRRWPGFHRLLATPGFQSFVERVPLLRRIARRDGTALFDLVQGFVAAQVLSALVERGVLAALLDGPRGAEDLARAQGLRPDRMAVLLQAGAALKLLRRRRDGRYGLARRGAATLGVPGLAEMLRHHRLFYADMADPQALLSGDAPTRVSRHWSYLASDEPDPAEAAAYSRLMARTQALVAEDTLRLAPLDGVRALLDVGGGSGAFLAAAAARHPALRLMLLDLPPVLPAARARFERLGLGARTALHPGSFRDGPLPAGADAISLVRVLYDHDDATARRLIAKARAALPPGGRLVISEPMSGGDRPARAADVYFAFYTLAMRSGRVRSSAEIAAMCREAGFATVRAPRPLRPFVTSVVIATTVDV